LSKNTGSNLWLVIGAWSLGVMVSSVVFMTLFNKPVEKVEDIREDLRIIKISILGILLLIIGGIIYVRI
jgi:hypothetical protein